MFKNICGVCSAYMHEYQVCRLVMKLDGKYWCAQALQQFTRDLVVEKGVM